MEQPTDTLGRRTRYARRLPNKERIDLHDDDFGTFTRLATHGPLTPPCLFPFTGYKNENAFKDRLTDLFHGGKKNGPFLDRPEFYRAFESRGAYIVYDLHDKGKEVLAQRGIPFVKRADKPVHRLMTATIGASIEWLCKQKGLRFIPRSEILARLQSEMKLPITLQAQKYLIPDELFGIGYLDGSYRFFAVEIDRGTEQYDEYTKAREITIAKKFAAYKDVMVTRPGVVFPYKEVWGIPNLMVIWYTTSASRVRRMKEIAIASEARLAPRHIFKCYRQFGALWQAPESLLFDIFEPYERANAEAFDISKS